MRGRTASSRKSPGEPPAGDAVYEIAVRALARRTRSTAEVRALLARRKASQPDIDAAVARLRDHGYLDDARYARLFVRSRIESEGHGAGRVKRDLVAKRVHRDVIEKAIQTGYEEIDEQQHLRDYLRRKLRLSKPPGKPSAVAALYRRLLRAGFSSATIVKELQAIRPEYRRGKGASPVDPDKWREWIESLAETQETEPEQE